MAKTVRQEIQRASLQFHELMQDSLGVIADDMVKALMVSARGLTPSARLKALSGLTAKGVNEYKALVLDAMVVTAYDAIERARKSVPKAKKVKLTVNIDDLPPKLRDKLKRRSQLLVGKQIEDLQNVVEFAYLQNEDTTDSDEQLEQDLHDSALGWLTGTGLSAGAGLTAASVINDARNAFFFDDEVLEEIEGFVFMNGDPVTQICQDLSEEFGPSSGNVISKDDPNIFRYTPPLHWGCKSWLEPVLIGNLRGREAKAFKPSKSSLDDEIQFHECGGCGVQNKVRMLTEQAEWQEYYQVLQLAVEL